MKRFTGKIKVGSIYKYEFSFTQDDVNSFAEITGDKNPIHIDEEYASKSLFKRRIIHGASVFSKVFAVGFPGEGTIYLKQDLKFMSPMFTSEKYTAVFTVVDLNKDKNRALVKTEVIDLKDEIVITGEALIKNQKYL